MKIFKPLLLIAATVLLFGCSNQELAYNEKATSLFLQEMKSIDENNQAFTDTAKVFHPDMGDSISLNTKAENIVSNASADIQNMNDLKPSEQAKEFHQSVLDYFGKIKHYGETAQKLLAANSNDKQALYIQLNEEYKSLDRMPDQVLEIQKAYQDKVGLKAK